MHKFNLLIFDWLKERLPKVKSKQYVPWTPHFTSKNAAVRKNVIWANQTFN